jgi:hypothetical protein
MFLVRWFYEGSEPSSACNRERIQLVEHEQLSPAAVALQGLPHHSFICAMLGDEKPKKVLSQVFAVGVNLTSCSAHSDASQVVAGVVVVVLVVVGGGGGGRGVVVVETEHVGPHTSTGVFLASCEESLISYLYLLPMATPSKSPFISQSPQLLRSASRGHEQLSPAAVALQGLPHHNFICAVLGGE